MSWETPALAFIIAGWIAAVFVSARLVAVRARIPAVLLLIGLGVVAGAYGMRLRTGRDVYRRARHRARLMPRVVPRVDLFDVEVADGLEVEEQIHQPNMPPSPPAAARTRAECGIT